jgi:hypothetical protein
MDEISKQLQSPAFWLCSVVISGLVMNIASRYVGVLLEKFVKIIGLGSKRLFVSWSERRASAFNSRLAQFEEWVEKHPHGVQLRAVS